MKRLLFALVFVAALSLPAVAVADGHGHRHGEDGHSEYRHGDDHGEDGHSRGHGNSWAAHACQRGGYLMLVRSDGTHFANVGACVSYAAHGGSLQSLQTGARSTAQGFLIPAGAVATLSSAHWNLKPCDALSYGYQLGSAALVTLASKPGGVCENGNLPGATLGPFPVATLLRVFLTDAGDPAAHVACDYTFYSTGSHALVGGGNPWRVDIRDSSFCSHSPNAPLAPAAPGQGNLELTVSVGRG